MKLRVQDIQQSEHELDFLDEVAAVNDALGTPGDVDYRFLEPIPVHLVYYRAGNDLIFEGSFAAAIEGRCARCLEAYPFELREDFRIVLEPAPEEGSPEDLAEDVPTWSGEDVDLSGHLQQEYILALPTRPVCREDCAGLCPRCGTNRNERACACPEPEGDPRLAILRNLKVRG